MNEPSNSQRHSNENSGLTLVEMIIAIAIIAMLALFFSPKFIQGTKMMEHSRRSSISINLANSEMEYLRSLDFDQIESAGGIKNITVDNHVYDIETIIVPHIIVDEVDGFTVSVQVGTNRVILDEPIQQTVQTYISR